MEKVYISKNSLKRIPFYMEYLKKVKETGKTYISSTSIAKGLGLNDVKVRKDLALISSTGGKPKVGYEIDKLLLDIETFLGMNNDDYSIIVGVGSLGSALLGYSGFSEYGLEIVGAFDASSNKVGQVINNIEVQDIHKIKEFCLQHNVHIGIITVPQTSAQEVCDELIDAGVKAIWNFAPLRLNVPEGILVQNENMASSLAVLSRHLNNKSRK